MLLGYNTNGFAHHDGFAALAILREIGYRSFAITLDHHFLNPYSSECGLHLADLRRLLDRWEIPTVIETGARFLLDPWTKHEPTLVSHDPADRARRVEFLRRAVGIAQQLGSDCVSLWSGIVHDGANADTAFERLVPGLRRVIDEADRRGMVIGFEPEPGMFIDTMQRYQELLDRIDAPCLKLTLDVGHLHCQGETPIADVIHRWRDRLVNVHIEDMRRGVHEHLQFGEGEIEFPPVLNAFREIGYSGGLHVELSRHSHLAPAAARTAFDFLQRSVEGAALRS